MAYVDLPDGCTGPFLPATWWEPSECQGCQWCEDQLPPLPPAEALYRSGSGVVWYRVEGKDEACPC